MNDLTFENQEIEKQFSLLEENISNACARVARKKEEVALVAVSKKQPLSKMIAYQDLCRRRGVLSIFGENYVQDFQKKESGLSAPYEAHLIGRLQSNKVKAAVNLFDVIESVDSLELLEMISAAAQNLGKRQRILIQVNISDDPRKSGIRKEELSNLIGECLRGNFSVSLEGLMTITQAYENKEEARPDFKALRLVKEEMLMNPEIQKAFSNSTFHLSMGMSQDFEVAIEEGATLVRIGTALFGERG